jgi:hypothetical protein
MRILEFFFEKGEQTKKDMTIKKLVICAFTAAILSVVISSVLRANGIHFQDDNVFGSTFLFGVIYSLIFLLIKRRSDS